MVDIGKKASKKPVLLKAPKSPRAAAAKSPVRDVTLMVESIIGCKWSLHVLSLVRRNVVRPGAMTRAVRGLTTKVLNERLAKMCRFGILERIAYPEVPPRVEYHFTEFGLRFLSIVDRVEEVQRELDSRSQ